MTNTEEPKSKFESPYKGQELAESHIQIMIGNADNNLIRSIRPRQGTLQTTVQILWNKLANELRKRNIIDGSSVDEFESFLTNSVLIDRDEYEQFLEFQRLHDGPVGGTSGGTRKSSSKSNGRKRAKAIRSRDSSTENVVPDVQSGSGTESRESTEGEKGSQVG